MFGHAKRAAAKLVARVAELYTWPDLPINDVMRRQLMAALIMAAVVIMTPFLVVDLRAGSFIKASVEVVVWGWCLYSLVYLQRPGSMRKIFFANSLVLNCFLIYLSQTGGVESGLLFWLYIIPLAPFFTLGKRDGLIVNLAFLGVVTVLMTDVLHLRAEGALPGKALARLLGSLFLLIVSGYFFEAIRHGIQEKLQQQKEMLKVAVEEVRLSNHRLETAYRRAELLAEEAEEANRVKNGFWATMSNEIRTPLNGVVGMTSFLAETGLSAEQRGYVDSIRNSASALTAMINDILDFARIEAEEMELEHIPFNLRELLEDVSDVLAYRAHEKGVGFSTFIGPDVPVLLTGDPARVRQIVVNLVNNAIQHTSWGEVSVHVGLEKANFESVTLRISVSDTGVGIDEGSLAALFDPYAQVGAEQTRRSDGMGLGLSITKRLAELMSGELYVESVVGEGSTFSVTCAFGLETADGLEPLPPLPEIRGRRVLVAAGSGGTRRQIGMYLRGWDASSQEVGSGFEALKCLREAEADNPFSVAILDRNLMDLTEERLVEIAQATAGNDDLRLIELVPASGRPPEPAIETRFDTYLPKPIKLAQLHESLTVALGTAVSPTLLRERYGAELTDEIRSRLRLLVAEDNFINQKVMRKSLEKLGFRNVEVVSTGREAIMALGRKRFDMVFMDCQMPEMDGYEATELIRSGEADVLNRNVPIIALTASYRQGGKMRCYSVGMNDYMAKPVDRKELNRLLERWFAPQPLGSR